MIKDQIQYFSALKKEEISYPGFIYKHFPQLLKTVPLGISISFIALVGITTTNFFCKTNGIKASTFLASLDSHSRTTLCVYIPVMACLYKYANDDDKTVVSIFASCLIGFLTSNVIAKPRIDDKIATALYCVTSFMIGSIGPSKIVSDVKNAPFAASACFLAGFAIADIYR